MRIHSASDISMLASMALAIGAAFAMSAAAMTSRTYATVAAARYTRWFTKPQAVKHFNKRTARHLTKVPM
jgi:curli biogenesis system outer membrane secretion channel CsgG